MKTTNDKCEICGHSAEDHDADGAHVGRGCWHGSGNGNKCVCAGYKPAPSDCRPPLDERKAGRAGFTPGPWQVSASDATEVLNWSRATYAGLKYPVAIRQSIIGGRTWSPESTAEAAANARLIAAAPELLAALEAIHAALNQPVQYTGIRNGASCDVLRGDATLAREMARAAIAKATEGAES